MATDKSVTLIDHILTNSPEKHSQSGLGYLSVSTLSKNFEKSKRDQSEVQFKILV